MAERKSGPVKPPVIDLKAHDASPKPADGKAAASAATARAAKSRTESRSETRPVEAAETPQPSARPAEPARAAPPRPQARLAMPWSAISIATVGGALLGTLLTYSLGNLLALPSKAPVIADPTERLDTQTANLAALTDRFATLEKRATSTQVSLDATIAQLDGGLNELRQSIADVRAAIPAPSAVDLAALDAELKTLESRVTAMGAGASSADATTLADTLSGIQAAIADLTGKLAAIDQRFAATDQNLHRIESELTAAKAAISAQTQTLGGTEIGPAVKLPLLVSGLENAFANGRSYVAELRGLTALLPTLAVPQAVRAAAEAGLPRPDVVAARFTDAVPDILAGRIGRSSGDWGQDALDWAKALIALRPSGEIAGNSPDAVVSRLESAVARRDFTAARDLLTQLPEPMRVAAGTLGDDIVALAEAESFIAGLRAQALAPAAEQSP